MKNQLNTEELTKLQNLLTVIQTTKEQVGQVEVQKHILLHKFDILSSELNKFKAELQESYGNVNIDFKTGKFTKIKNDESNKED